MRSAAPARHAREPRSPLFRARRFLDVAAAPRADRYGRLDRGVPRRAAPPALDGRGARATPTRAPLPARARPTCGSSTSSRTCRATCCPRPTSPRWRVSLELRSPFLDHRVVELGARAARPLELAAGKVALRRAFAADLPPEIAARGKAGFGVPLDRWFREELRDARRRPAARRAARERGLLPAARPSSACSPSTAARADHGHRLWCLVHARALAAALRRRRRGARRRVAAPRDARARRATRSSRPPACCRGSPCSLHERGDDPRAFTEKSDGFARDVRRERHVRLHPGRAVGVHAAALRLLPHPDLLGRRPHWLVGRARADRASPSRRRCSSTRSAAADLAARRRRRGRDRDAAAVPRLARRPRQPRDPRPAARARRSCCSRSSRPSRRSLWLVGRARASSPGWRSSRTRASSLLPLVLAGYLALAAARSRRAAPRWSCSRGAGARRDAVGRPQQGRRSAASRSRPTRARCGRRTTSQTYDLLARGGWIDDVARRSRAHRPGPSVAARRTIATGSRWSTSTSARRCAVRATRSRLLARAPGEKARADGAGDGDAVAAAVFESRRGRVGGRASTASLRQVVEPLYVIPLLRARDRRAVRRRRAGSSCSRCCFLGYETVVAMGLRRRRRATACPGTSCSRCSRRQRSRGCRSDGDLEAAVRRPVEPVAVDLLGPLGAAVLREALDRAARALAPHRERRSPGRSRAGASPSASRSASPGGDEQTRLALAHEVLEPADRGRDHAAGRAPSPRARPSRTPRRATARRPRATPRSRAGRASRGRGSGRRRSSPSSRARALQAVLEHAAPGDVEPRGRAARRARARNARRSTTWPLIGISRPMQRKRGALARVRRGLAARRDPVVDDLEVAAREALGVARGSGRGRARSRSGGAASAPIVRSPSANSAPLAELVEAVLRREPDRDAARSCRPSGRRRPRGRDACAGSSAACVRR